MQELIAGNIRRIRERIGEACAKAHRDPAAVRLVVITKSADMRAVQAAVELGVQDLGESRAQQLVQRADQLKGLLAGAAANDEPASPHHVRWHMVGHLQRNKVKLVLPLAHLIHSIDSVRLAEYIDKHARAAGLTVEGLLEVNCSQEPQKAGVPLQAAATVVEQLATLGNLRLRGLMTMAPLVSDMELARSAFARLREVYEEIVAAGAPPCGFDQLSMGMSADYPVAVEEGATVVRIGTAVFQGVP